MNQIDTNLISGIRAPQGIDVASAYDNAARIAQNAQAMRDVQTAEQNRQIVAEGYRRATNPDGTVNQGVLLSHLAKNGLGAQVPGLSKALLDNDKTRAEIDAKKVDTSSKSIENLYRGLKEADNTIAGLLAKPDVNERDVYGEMGRLVRVGVFDVQAAHKGVTPDEFAKDLLSTMPVGNPQALRSWLLQTGARTADASKRLELALPKYDAQDRGGVINQGTVNLMTGQRTEGTDVKKTATPGEILADNRAREKNRIDQDANAINKEAQNNQLVETPQGYVLVNKGTTLARPVATMSGQPVLGKDSPVAENANMSNRLMEQISKARDLLPKATSSSGGAVLDRMLGLAGISTKGADAAAALDTLSGWMTSNVPRMQGPQSDKDAATYQIMAGMVGDRSKPVSQRLAALEVVEGLMKKYQNAPGTAPATVVPPPIVPQRGSTSAPQGGVSRQPTGVAPTRISRSPAPDQGLPPIESFFIRN